MSFLEISRQGYCLARNDVNLQKMIRLPVIFTMLLGGALGGGTLGAAPALALKDVDGHVRTPLRGSGQQPAVVFFITHDCPVANKFAPEIRRIANDFRGKAQFTLAYVDPDLTAKKLARHRRDYGYRKLTAIHDRQHQLVRATGAKVTPEAVVVDSTGKIVYRGRINNFYEDFGKPRRVITQHDLRDALKALLAGQPVPQPQAKAIGCFIPKLK